MYGCTNRYTRGNIVSFHLTTAPPSPQLPTAPPSPQLPTAPTSPQLLTVPPSHCVSTAPSTSSFILSSPSPGS